MSASFSFRPYRRRFRRPLRTARGIWASREGFIVRVEQDGQVGYGEVAPLPEFGTETPEQALAFLESVTDPGQPVPASLPCCAFGLSAARTPSVAASRDYPLAALLPAGPAAVEAFRVKQAAGFGTFKWKIGVGSPAAELAIFNDLAAASPEGVRFRLDANGSLEPEQLEEWLAGLRAHRDRIDYVEQALPPGAETEMARLAEKYELPVALDESLNGPEGAQWLEPGAWVGPLIIKAALMGDVSTLSKRLSPLAGQLVFSSVFETAVGMRNALALADALPEAIRAIGFDTASAFDDRLTWPQDGARLSAENRRRIDLSTLWKQLPLSNSKN